MTKFYLDATTHQLSSSPALGQGYVEYHASERRDEGVLFTHTFDRYTEMCGFSRVRLYMSCEDHNDMDVYVVLRKKDRDGRLLEHINIPLKDLPSGTTAEDLPNLNVFKYIGPNGRLRASHRKVAEEPGLTLEQRKLLSDAYVWHPHTEEEKVEPGQIVELDIGLWPGGMVFDAGESIVLIVKGSLPILPEHPGMAEKMPNYNVGYHRLHTGKQHPSLLQMYITHGDTANG
jgi:uncharacterized protein